MFTGIVTDIGEVVAVEPRAQRHRAVLADGIRAVLHEVDEHLFDLLRVNANPRRL